MPPSSAYLIGLTGGIASGKSNLARALKEAGAAVIDADEIAAGLTGEGGAALPYIREAFGDQVFMGDRLDRRALAARIFSSDEDRKKLNAVMHPMMLKVVEKQRQELAGQKLLFLEAALLYEAGWHSICDEVWCAYVPAFCQVIRVTRRDKVSCREAIRRVSSQMPGIEKARRADHTICTWRSKGRSAAKALRLWRDTLKKLEGATQHA